MFHTLEQAFAARLDRTLYHFWIGDREVRGRQRLGHILRGEFHLRARMFVESLHRARGREQLFGKHAIGLADQREDRVRGPVGVRSEEHTSELQSLMRISYAVFCLKNKKKE